MKRQVFSSDSCRVLAIVFVLGLALCLAILSPGSLQAAAVGCRTDPIVTLSNGDVVSIYVDIATDPSQVKSINYMLHVPDGVTATNITYLGGAFGLSEHLTLTTQGSDTEYRSETVVNAPKSVSVTATMVYGAESDTATGKAGKTLDATIDINNP